jgi:hypothetical protein
MHVKVAAKRNDLAFEVVWNLKGGGHREGLLSHAWHTLAHDSELDLMTKPLTAGELPRNVYDVRLGALHELLKESCWGFPDPPIHDDRSVDPAVEAAIAVLRSHAGCASSDGTFSSPYHPPHVMFARSFLFVNRGRESASFANTVTAW